MKNVKKSINNIKIIINIGVAIKTQLKFETSDLISDLKIESQPGSDIGKTSDLT